MAGHYFNTKEELSDQVMVIVRSADEATQMLCQQLIENEVSKENIAVVREVPFSRAVRKTFELGLESDKKWTLAVDADILLRENAIKDMVNWAEQCEDYFFELQGRVFDKFFCTPRPGGPHLYRTEYLEKAISFIPGDPNHLRPESYTYHKMAETGLHFYHDLEVYGIHDFFQYYRDIHRKCFVHASKHGQYLEYFLTQWTARANDDTDYVFAIKGILDGLSHKEEVRADSKYFNDKVTSINFIKESKEKTPIRELPVPVGEIITRFESNSASTRFGDTTMHYFKRSDQVDGKLNNQGSLLYKIVWNLGARIERAGNFIKNKA